MPIGTCVAAGGRNQEASWVWIASDELSGWVTSEYLVIDGDLISLPTDFKAGTPESIPTTLVTETPGLPTPTMTKTDTPPSEHILCKDTWTRIDEEVTCKLPKPTCTYKYSENGEYTFCRDIPYPDQSFTFLIWGGDWSYIDGKCLLISGHVMQVDGKPLIEAYDTEDVSICQ